MCTDQTQSYVQVSGKHKSDKGRHRRIVQLLAGQSVATSNYKLHTSGYCGKCCFHVSKGWQMAPKQTDIQVPDVTTHSY